MKKLLEDTLKLTNLKYYYLKRPRDVFPCITYHINENVGVHADCMEESAEYNIYLNLCIKENITQTVEDIKKVMNRNNFIKISINAPIVFDGTDYYQVTFHYRRFKANDI